MGERLYFKQLKAGRDFSVGDPVATQMDNFIYLIGDRVAGECLVVDPAWDVQGVVDVAAADDMKVAGALVTHWHPDHVGGPLFGHDVEGIARFLEVTSAPVHVHKDDAWFVEQVTGVAASELAAHEHGHVVKVGEVEVECLHTPGHTAGSQCFRCRGALIAGDTLFLQGCGRLDLPGSDIEQMYDSLYNRLGKLPGDLVLYPGHDYGAKPHAPLQEVRATNPSLRVPDIGMWRRMYGRA